jgi:hypothetical protein
VTSEFHSPYYHVGIAVHDLDVVREELSRVLPLTWSDTLSAEAAGWPIRVCYAQQGPPYLELIEGPAGSPWDASRGSRLDHVGVWSEEIERDTEHMVRQGFVVEADGGYFVCLRGPQSGSRIELVAAAGRGGFYRAFGLENPLE